MATKKRKKTCSVNRVSARLVGPGSALGNVAQPPTR